MGAPAGRRSPPRREATLATTNNPTRLNDRHLFIALMLMSGYRQCEIADALGYTENRVSVIANSPLFRAQMDDLRGELRERTMGDAMAMIEREAANSVRVLLDVRDNASGPTADNLRRLAANDLLDRHPTLGRRQRDDADRVLRIEFSTAQVQQMQAALPRPVGQGSTGQAATASRESVPANGHAQTTLTTLDAAIAAARESEP